MFKKTTLLAASTALSLVASTSAFAADNNYAAAAINGNGASSVANVLVQELNCFGGPNNDLGFGNGTTATIPDHNYVPTSPTAGNPVYNCATKSVQDLVNGHYISTGSGAGKNNWKGKVATNGITTNPFGTWANIHYAFSDSPISASDLSTYNSTAAPTTKAAIQIPMYVLPVAVAYAPAYGKIMTGTGVQNLTFNVKVPHADGTGGLRMKKATYCGIFNGTITNWNDAALKADNGGQSLMSTNDNLTRWNTTGVPIKLIGRNENSGTTNIFTRHLSAVCGGSVYNLGGQDQLPAGALSTAIYDKATGALTSGSEVAGKFGRVDGSDGIAHTVDVAIADPVAVGDVTLNGRLGYVGADWVAPSTLSGSTLHSADLQQGLTTSFKAATAVNATLAFKGILPPQSLSTGKYDPASTAVGQMPGVRTDPLAWVFPANATTGVANPAFGYPIVGTTNMLLYTCYASPAVRNAIQGFGMLHLGKVTIADDLTKVPAKLVTSTAKDAGGLMLGIDPRNGIAPLPASFTNAIVETFFTKVVSGNNPGGLNLWIQDKLQKKSTDVLTGNSTCSPGVGA